MAIANFDEIIRRILGLDKPAADVAQPFVASPAPGVAEEELPPMDSYPWHRRQVIKGIKQDPYHPGNERDFVAPLIIPNTRPEDTEFFTRPLDSDKSKQKNGIDI
jgi:hypothetical protein